MINKRPRRLIGLFCLILTPPTICPFGQSSRVHASMLTRLFNQRRPSPLRPWHRRWFASRVSEAPTARGPLFNCVIQNETRRRPRRRGIIARWRGYDPCVATLREQEQVPNSSRAAFPGLTDNNWHNTVINVETPLRALETAFFARRTLDAQAHDALFRRRRSQEPSAVTSLSAGQRRHPWKTDEKSS